MNQAAIQTLDSQLRLPGIPTTVAVQSAASSESVRPGQQVLYLGKVAGGPRYGTRGLVKQTLSRRAVVDMGRSGVWHIPYYFLALPVSTN